LKYNYHPPFLVKKIFSDFIWETSNKKILLTFDDGPIDSATLKILKVLELNKIKAVFFCVGNNIIKHPDLIKKMLADGHTIANHTMNHKSITKMKREETIGEIDSFNKELKDNFNYDVKYFRPPFGRFTINTKNLLNELNLKCVMWNLLTYDYENRIQKVKYAIDNYLKANSIIVFHDNNKCADIIEESLNYTIQKAKEKGFEFGEPENCLN
jgi:peptidoglycan/xylan/chitin deacetylase (PgdA/CDA1 family)